MTDNTKIYANDDRWYTIADETTIRADERAKIINEVLELLVYDDVNDYWADSQMDARNMVRADLRAKLEEMKEPK
jgi:hypothetical protein